MVLLSSGMRKTLGIIIVLIGEKVNDYFSDVFAIAASQAENLRARDISAVHAKVYVSGLDYVENADRSFLDRYYSLFLASIGAIIVILGINLLSEKNDEY